MAKILHNEDADNPGIGKVEILQTKEAIQKQVKMIELAGRTCYRSYKKAITYESAEKFVKMLIKRGHHSVIEHGIITVKFSRISRGCSHELVRHRLASASQQSSRFVDFANEDRVGDHIMFVAPPHRDIKEVMDISDGKNRLDVSFADMCCVVEAFYKALRKNGWAPEDARQILPIGLATEIVITANFREWRHIFELRCGSAAHWEIRSVMCRLLKLLKQIVPSIFFDFEEGSKCKNGISTYVLNKLYENS